MKRTARGRGDAPRRLLSVLRLIQGLRFGWTLTEIQQEVGGGEYCSRTIQRDLATLIELGFAERCKTQRGWVYKRKEPVENAGESGCISR